VIDVTDASLDDFGEDRLARVLSASAARSAGEIIGALLDATRAYSRQTRYEDDFTLLVVKRLPTGDRNVDLVSRSR
jgi:serine phosphatase RsbU (regulator of sigma subunit)